MSKRSKMLLTLGLALLSACSFVDEAPLDAVRAREREREREQDASDGVRDAMTGDSGDGDASLGDSSIDPKPDGGEDAEIPPEVEPFLADRCPLNPDNAYFLPSAATSLTLDTSELANDVHQGTGLKCTGADAPGNDGFLGIEMRFGDVWHIHMAPDPDPDTGAKNPAFYVLDSTCAVRDCGFGIDVCSRGVDEHFTFAARRDGLYYLGIDDQTPGGGKYVFSANRVECGNGKAQHGKACDYMTDDACDTECRIVLDAVNPTESSKSHDDFTVANVVTFPATGAKIADVGGGIGGCEPDYYTFNASEGDSVRITLLTDGLSPCTDLETDRFTLELEDGRAERLQAGVATGDNTCPSIVRQGLVEGRYYVKLADTNEDGAELPFSYRLRIELNPL
jgi:hypothetical protein